MQISTKEKQLGDIVDLKSHEDVIKEFVRVE